MKQTTRGEKQTASTPRPMTIFLQPGQVLTIIAADGSGNVPRSALELAAGVSDARDGGGSVSPSRDPDSSVSPSASRDRSGRL